MIPILVVDDDPVICEFCKETLELHGYIVHLASNGTTAMERLESTSYFLVLSDIMMPDTNGLELLAKIRREHPDTFVILFTGHATINLATEAIRLGAFDFLTKPFALADLVRTVDRAFEIRSRKISDLPDIELKALYDLTVSTDIFQQDYQSFLDRYTEALRRSFRADHVRVLLSTSNGESGLTLTASCGRDEFIHPDKWDSISAEIIESGEASLMEIHLTESDSETAPDSCFIMGSVMPSREGHIGVTIAARHQATAPFTPRDLKLLSLFTAQAGNQVMNYRLAQDLRDNTSQLEEISRITGKFSTSLDPGKVLSFIGEGLKSIIPFDLFGLFLISGTGLPLLSYILARSDLPADFIHQKFRQKLEARFGRYMISIQSDTESIETFEAQGSVDFESEGQMLLMELDMLDQSKGVLILGSWSRQDDILESKQKFMPILLREAAAALDNAQLHEDSHRNYTQTISAFAQAVDAKDRYTHNHSRNVTAYSLALADNLCLPERDRLILWNTALLHDIGKIGIPEEILNKPGKLTNEEYGVLKEHPEKGCTILEPVSALRELLEGIRHHHERWDGRGYPEGLTGERIPFHARILAIADAFDAMLSDRVYRDSPGLDYALTQVLDCAGTQFDPYLADAFLDILKRNSPAAILSNYISEITGSTVLRG